MKTKNGKGEMPLKPDMNKRYASIAVYAALVMLVCILVVFSFLRFDAVWRVVTSILSVFMPILIGAMLAYVFCPIVGFFEKHVYHGLNHKRKFRLKRVFSVISTFIIVILGMLVLILKVIPAVFRGYADLTIMSELYLEILKEWLMGISFGENSILTGYFETFIGYFTDLLDTLYGAIFEVTPDITSLAGALVGVLGDAVLGIILSIYFLFSKEKILAQFKKMTRAFLSRRKFGAFERSVKMTNEKFGGFLKGQIADALIIGTLSYICLSIIGVPYYPLVSVIVGVSALIPVFGILIGTLIGACIILLAAPLTELWFVLFMLALHFVNKYMIKPRVVRTTVDASSVFMLTAIVITTGLVGVWGLVFGVPVFAVLYAFLHSLANRSLTSRGLSTEPYEYYATRSGKGLYVEREDRRRSRGRFRPKGEDPDVFALHDDEAEEEGSLFAPSLPSEQQPPEHDTEFPQ